MTTPPVAGERPSQSLSTMTLAYENMLVAWRNAIAEGDQARADKWFIALDLVKEQWPHDVAVFEARFS